MGSMFWIKVGLKLEKIHARLNTRSYMKNYTELLMKAGMNISTYDGIGYIDPTCFIDSSDYKLITIEKHVTISRNVTLLTHDFSIGKGLASIGIAEQTKRYKFLKGIRIGEESFIGLNAIILPGTNIGKFCIIGSGAVVKGNIPDYSICIGNPARIIGDIREWTKSHIDRQDFITK